MNCEIFKEENPEIIGENQTGSKNEPDTVYEMILDYIQECPAIFQSQQLGDPELTKSDKRQIAEDLMNNRPLMFLNKFAKFLREDHLNYISQKHSTSEEVKVFANNLRISLDANKLKSTRRNRRFEAMKRMEAGGSYFSETEMEKREPLLYHQMVGQYLNEKEKLKKNREANKNIIPTFSNFLIDKYEKEELSNLIAIQQKAEDDEEKRLRDKALFEDEICQIEVKDANKKSEQKWGKDWEDDESCEKTRNLKKQRTSKVKQLSLPEKALLYEEFKSIMQNKFLNGNDDFNYSDVDSNSDYDCLELIGQDAEEKYFDEELDESDCVCTDTGIEDY